VFTENFINDLVTKPVTCTSIVRSFIQHAVDTTKPYRDFMTNFRGKKVPDDYTKYPGKLDHTSSLSFKVNIKKAWTRGSSTEIKTNGPQNGSPQTNPTSTRQSQPTRETSQLLQLDIPCVLLDQKAKLALDDNNNHDMIDEANDPDLAVWNSLFGTETYVVEWNGFVEGLQLGTTETEEKQLKTVIDYADTGSVTRFKFQEFLKGFGPIDKCLENVKKLVTAEYFHGFLGPNESKTFLENQPIGTFLMRFSGSRPGSFVIDYVLKLNQVRSVRLTSHTGGGFAVLITTPGSQTEKIFKSLQEVIETYSNTLFTRPFSSTLSQKSWFFGDITAEEAESLLRGQPTGTFLIRFSKKKPGSFAASFVAADGSISKGLITKNPALGGYQVNEQGVAFNTLDNLIQHYIAQGIFTQELQ